MFFVVFILFYSLTSTQFNRKEQEMKISRFCLVLLLLVCVSNVSSQENDGFLMADQWPDGIGYTGGIYLFDGVTFQAQFVGLERNYLVIGGSFPVWKFGVDINSGFIVGRDNTKIYGLSFQCNASHGDNTARFNIRMDNEFDPGIQKGEPDIIWAFHWYTYRVSGVYLGVCAEFNDEITDGDHEMTLMPGPIIKYWLTPKVNVAFSPRGKIKTGNNTFRLGNIYLNLTYLFKH